MSQIASELSELGVSRIHTFAWRDLDDPEAGGSEVHADQIFQRWAKHGFEITHRTSTSDKPRDFSRNGYRVIQRRGRYSVFPSAIMSEIRSGRSSRDAVIEIWNGVPWFSQLWSRVPTNVWLHHIHGPMWKQSLPPGLAQMGNLLESRIAPKFYKRTPVITLADSGKEELLHLGFSPKQVHVVNPGVDDVYCVDDSVSRTAHPSLVAVGRLAPVKRFDLLIDSFAKARQHVPALTLSIVGDGPDRQSLQDLANRTPGVTLTGRLDGAELITLYRQSWLAVSMSIAEGWGMTLTEAAACGTPAVVIDNSGHRDSVLNGVTGLVSRDPDAFVADLVQVIQDQRLWTALRDGALSRSHQLRWDQAAGLTLSHLLDEVRRQQS